MQITLTARERENAALLYVHALDEGNAQTIAALLELSRSDSELSTLFCEIDREFEQEIEAQWQAEAEQEDAITPDDVQTVREILHDHLPSAHEPRPSSPLTVGDVASQLLARKRVPEEEAIARQLQDNSMPVPLRPDKKQMAQLVGQLRVDASEKFWRAFRETMVSLFVGRTSAQAQFGLAREARSSHKLSEDSEPISFNEESDTTS